jgi:hypothetical protein
MVSTKYVPSHKIASKSVIMANIPSLIYVNLSSLVSLVVSYYAKLKHKNFLYYLMTTREQKNQKNAYGA